jgi:NADH-ubiquinone oxidoreductase chain 5
MSNASENSWKITYPLIILTIFSIFFGFFSKDFFIGIGTPVLNNSIFIQTSHFYLVDIEFISFFFKQLPFFLTILGIVFSFFLYLFNLEYFLLLKQKDIFILIYTFFNKKWYFDRFYNQFLTQRILSFSYIFSYKDMDRGFSEVFGPRGLSILIFYFGRFLKKFQTGIIFHYLLFFMFFFFLQIFLLCFLSLF